MRPETCWRDRVALHRHEIVVAGRRWRVDAVKDQDALLAASEHFDVFPYGLLLWDSAPVLADALAGFGDLTGKRVLELGAGVGLAGLAARHLGAEVVQTDHSAEALELACANAALNGIGGIAQELADWSQWTPSGRFDLVLGSDILYDEAAHGAVARLLSTCLAESGLALLSDPGRTATPGFLRAMRAEGWRIETVARSVPALHPSRADEQALITVLRLERSCDLRRGAG